MGVSKESFTKRSLGQAAALLCVQQQRGSLETELCKPSLDFWQKPWVNVTRDHNTPLLLFLTAGITGH